MPTVLTILPEGFEELEAVAPIDVLRRAGIEVTVASLSDSIHVGGRSKLIMHADATLEMIGDKLFDMLFLPGGPGVKHLRASHKVRDYVLRHHQAGRFLAAICAAPTVLHDAGLLQGRRYTAHFSVAEELGEVRADERVVVDETLITSRGAGTAIEFGLALVEALCGPEKAAEISQAICA